MELYRLAGFPDRRHRKELLARGRKAAAHAAGGLAGAAAAGAGAGREADRPLRQGPDPDRRRPHRAGLRAPLREPAAGAGQLAGRAARQFGRPADHRRQRIHHAVSAAPHRALPRAVSQGEGAGAAQPFEQDSRRAAGRQPGAGRDQLRSRRRAPEVEGDLHRRAGVRGVAEAPPGAPQDGLHHRAGRGELSSRTTWFRRTATW